MQKGIRVFTAMSVIAVALPDCGAQSTSRTFHERLAAALTDTSLEARSRVTLAAYYSGVWLIDGEFRDDAGRAYHLGGYVAMVMDPDTPISVSAPTMIAAFRLSPRAGGGESWLGGRLRCTAVVSLQPAESLNRICQFAGGARSLLGLDLEFSASTMDAASTAVVTILDRSDRSPEPRGEPALRGRFRLIPAMR